MRGMPRFRRLKRLGVQAAHLLGLGQQRLHGATRVFQLLLVLLELIVALAQLLLRRP
ncbi:hypothetical protein D3C81_2227130 [compost metagenome]